MSSNRLVPVYAGVMPSLVVEVTLVFHATLSKGTKVRHTTQSETVSPDVVTQESGGRTGALILQGVVRLL